ncbi:MAG: hypothetical protein NXI08_17190, partial [bacterium]|nr:hypothetical protein [bacterium]
SVLYILVYGCKPFTLEYLFLMAASFRSFRIARLKVWSHICAFSMLLHHFSEKKANTHFCTYLCKLCLFVCLVLLFQKKSTLCSSYYLVHEAYDLKAPKGLQPKVAMISVQ